MLYYYVILYYVMSCCITLYYSMLCHLRSGKQHGQFSKKLNLENLGPAPAYIYIYIYIYMYIYRERERIVYICIYHLLFGSSCCCFLPDPRRSELSKGILRRRQATVLGFEALNLKSIVQKQSIDKKYKINNYIL